MIYLLAILLPPLGMLLAGKWVQAIICFVLMCAVITWPIASIWAVLVVMDHRAERRAIRIARAMRAGA